MGLMFKESECWSMTRGANRHEGGLGPLVGVEAVGIPSSGDEVSLQASSKSRKQLYVLSTKFYSPYNRTF